MIAWIRRYLRERREWANVRAIFKRSRLVLPERLLQPMDNQ